jgi:hypothetical protein
MRRGIWSFAIPTRSERSDRLEAYSSLRFGVLSVVRTPAGRRDVEYSALASLIKAGNEERKGNRKPDKEGRIIRIISAVVITSPIISAVPVASALSSVSVVSVTAVIISVVTPVVIATAAGMNGSMTGMGRAGLGRSNSEQGDKNKTQHCYGFHVNYCNSVAQPRTLALYISSLRRRGERVLGCLLPR